MTGLKKVAAGAAALVALLLIVGLLLPRTAHVQRSIVIQAPQATVFAVLNGFRAFQQWSPWADLDPDATTTIEGPATGVGAKLSWSGNSRVGTGSQEIIEAIPYHTIRLRLTFGDFAGDFGAAYRLDPEAGGTKVTWSFEGDYGGSIGGRYFGLFSDSMVGPDYEKGLAELKALVERLPAGDFAALNIASVYTAAQPIVYTSIRSGNTVNAIGVALGVAYSRLSGFMATARLGQAGPPVAIFRGRDKDTLQFDAAIPVDRADAKPSGAIRVGELPPGRAVRAEHRGSYAGLFAAHEQVRTYLAVTGLVQDGDPWEQFVSDPARTPEGELITYLYYPVK